ncbi:MAG: hypothetical protein ABI142_12505, partial [Bryocella sp.]
SAGFSEPFFAAAGTAPQAISSIDVVGSRRGVVISWKATLAGDEIVIRRDDLSPKAASTPVFLTLPPDAAGSQVVDGTAALRTSYRYTAEVRREVTIGNRHLVLRSAPSPAVTYVLRDVYPPPMPTDLTAAVFPLRSGKAGMGVDLIWQPVEDAGLKGYVVYRSSGEGPRERLTKVPVTVPAYHDEVSAVGRWTYSVSSIDTRGNESATTSTVVEVPAQ